MGFWEQILGGKQRYRIVLDEEEFMIQEEKALSILV